jgi:hypothetical protein
MGHLTAGRLLGSRMQHLVTAGIVALGGGLLAAPPQAAAEEPERCTVDELLVNSCRPWFGATANGYPEVSGRKLDQMLYFEERAGRRMEVAHTFHPPGDDQLTAHDVAFATRPGTFLLTNWALTRDWSTADGSDPAVNAQIDTMAASIAALGETRIFLVLFHEPENDVTEAPSCADLEPKGAAGTPAEYRAMWANVRARFDAAGVSNVVWVMNYMNHPPNNCLVDDLYPGDDLVDWVMFTGYQHGDKGVDFQRRVGNMYDLLSASSRPGHDYLSKPWGIAEWGINNSTQENAHLYYAQAKEAVEAGVFPRLKMYLSFDAGDAASGDASHRVAYDREGRRDDAEQEAYNRFAHSPAFAGEWQLATPEPEPEPEPEPSVDTTAPTVPTQVRVSLRRGVPRVVWAWSQDDVGVAGYEVLRGGQVVGTTTRRQLTDAEAPQGRRHTYRVRARDAAGNLSALSARVRVLVPDTVAPGPPRALQVVARASRRVTVRWRQASDNVGVARYLVFRGATRVGAVRAGTTRFVVTGLRPGRRTTIRVLAVDAAGNRSGAAQVVGRAR